MCQTSWQCFLGNVHFLQGMFEEGSLVIRSKVRPRRVSVFRLPSEVILWIPLVIYRSNGRFPLLSGWWFQHVSNISNIFYFKHFVTIEMG